MYVDIEFRPIKMHPESWARRDSYERSRFDSSYTSTRKLLDRELQMLDASNVVLQVQARESQITRDGRLRADARLEGPGVILSFDTPEHGTLTYDTDRFVHWHDNLRAIALGLEALRRVERYGIADRGQQYAGYRELGSGIALGPPKLNAVDAARLLLDAWHSSASGVTADHVDVLASWSVTEFRQRVWRAVSKRYHPDYEGGDGELFARLVEARDLLDKTCRVTTS